MKERILNGELSLGAWISSGSPIVADLLGRLGYDWLVIDTEHSPVGPETMTHMVQALGAGNTAPLVRVGLNDQYLVKSALDSGACGVVVPLVNDESEASRAVSFAKYPPLGVRGAAGTRASQYGLNFADYVRRANDETLVIVQVETSAAVNNIEKILNVSGVDVAFVGPSDLTISLGLVDDRANERVTTAMKSVIEACTERGKIAGVMTNTPEEMKQAIRLGFKFISLASDTKYLIEAGKSILGLARDSSSNSS